MNKYDLNSASIFEKTMSACLEAKRANAVKKQPTSKKAAKKNNKTINEAVKRRKVTEDEDVLDDAEADLYTDDTTMSDTVDDIVVVVDPELDTDEVDEFVDELQDIVDGTPEGETPFIDDYVDDFTYTCPICGNTFFSDNEMSSGDACPVCGDTPTNFVLVGSVQSPEADTEDEEDVPAADDVDDDVVDEVPEDDTADDDEELEPAEPTVDEPAAESKKRPSYRYTIDESTFNPYLTKFIRENYKNAKSFVITGARRAGKNLTVECKITFKSGKTKKVEMRCNNFVPAPVMKLSMRDNGVFKSESKRVAPFVFTAKMEKHTLKCTGLKYNFTTVTEGKRVQISGNLVEKKANFRRGRRV